MAFDQSDVRTGNQCFLTLDGITIPGLKINVHNCAERKSDTFHAELSMTACTEAGLSLMALSDQAFESAQVTFVVNGQPGQKFDGIPDEIEFDFDETIVCVSGRDKSANFTDKRQNKQHKNKKSSEVFDDVSKDAELEGQSEQTDDNAGKKYADDDVHLHLNKNLFEAANDLAEREGYRWYVDGDKPRFEPKDSQGSFSVNWRPPSAQEYANGNAVRLKARRNLHAGKTIKHKGKSWHHKDRKTYEHTATAQGKGGTLEYEHHFHNHDQKKIEKIMKSRAKDTIRHEHGLTISMPGDFSVTPRMSLSLNGTGTKFDHSHEIESVEFDMSWGGGFEMHIHTKAPSEGRQVQ